MLLVVTASMTELVTQTCNLINSVGYPEILIEVADAKNDEDEKPDDPYSISLSIQSNRVTQWNFSNTFMHDHSRVTMI